MRGSTVREAVDGIECGCTWLVEDRGRRAGMLDAIAKALTARRDEIIELACEETALMADEFVPEFARMTRTFWMFAGVVREGSWVRAAVDRPAGEAGESIGPNHDVRRMLVPLGPAAVFGASNFPLSYGVCGGDTASALAAGCAVVVKEHPAHPRLGRLLHEIALEAIESVGGPGRFVLGYVENLDPKDNSIAQALVSDVKIQAVGFTGSQRGGMALQGIANRRPRPIPVFAEMGSANAVYITVNAARRRGEEIAKQLADSILVRVGQQCTKPGLIFVGGLDAARELVGRMCERFAAAPARDMLASWIAKAYRERVESCRASAGVEMIAQGVAAGGDRAGTPTLMRTSHSVWRESPALQEEVFGPFALLIDVEQDHLLRHYADVQQPNLVSCWYTEEDDGEFGESARWGHGSWFPVTGRVVFNGLGTGVRVAHGMVHSGPLPACNRPDTTAVGPFAIERWCRPVCLQNAPQELLPDELKDSNPLGIGRLEDGVYVARRST